MPEKSNGNGKANRMAQWLIGILAGVAIGVCGFMYGELGDLEDKVHANDVAIMRVETKLEDMDDKLDRLLDSR